MDAEYRRRVVWMRFAGVGSLALVACASVGCVSSRRAEFLAVREAAPTPRKSAPVTLAEAERSTNGDRSRAIARVAEVPAP